MEAATADELVEYARGMIEAFAEESIEDIYKVTAEEGAILFVTQGRYSSQPKMWGMAYSSSSRRMRSMSMVSHCPSLYMTLPRAIFMHTSAPWAE